MYTARIHLTIYYFTTWNEAYEFAKLFNVVETMQYKTETTSRYIQFFSTIIM